MKQRLKDLKDQLVILLFCAVGRDGIIVFFAAVVFIPLLFGVLMLVTWFLGVPCSWQIALLTAVGLFVPAVLLVLLEKKRKYALLFLAALAFAIVLLRAKSRAFGVNGGEGFSWQTALLLGAVSAVPAWLLARWDRKREERRQNEEQERHKTEGTAQRRTEGNARMWARGGKSSPRGNFSPRRSVYTEKNKKPRK